MNLGLVSLDFHVDMLVAPLRAKAEHQGKLRTSTYEKGQVILHQGDVASDIFILQSGLVKLVYPTLNGDEWIKSFIVDRGLFGSVDDGDAAQPSRFAAIPIESSVVAQLPLDWVKRAIANDTELTAAYVAFSGWVRRRKEEREEVLLCKSAEQSYLNFISTNAALAKRLPQGDIAHYLGITPVAFSRIKRRLRS
jgi:CRP/FNR family transcriptional regulator, anaerobic regulatory protein